MADKGCNEHPFLFLQNIMPAVNLDLPGSGLGLDIMIIGVAAGPDDPVLLPSVSERIKCKWFTDRSIPEYDRHNISPVSKYYIL